MFEIGPLIYIWRVLRGIFSVKRIRFFQMLCNEKLKMYHWFCWRMVEVYLHDSVSTVSGLCNLKPSLKQDHTVLGILISCKFYVDYFSIDKLGGSGLFGPSLWLFF